MPRNAAQAQRVTDAHQTQQPVDRSTNKLESEHLLQRAQSQPQTLTPQDVKTLQRTIGNQATTQILQPLLQPQLTLGPAGDQYEVEADQVADQVVSAIQSAPVQRQDQVMEAPQETGEPPSIARAISTLQRKPLTTQTFQKPGTVQREVADEEEMLQGKLVQREAADEEEMLQGKSLQRSALHGPEGGEVESSVAQQIQTARGSGKPLDDGVRDKMETGFGADFSQVRVHTGAQADNLNRSLNARAFTTGNDIFFGQGEYNPGSSGGQKLIAHELTHTVQQTGGAQRTSDNESTIRRKYLDRETKWKGDTAFKVGPFARPRTKAMREIDKAVEQWLTTYDQGDLAPMMTAARAIVTQIDAWRQTKEDADTAMRGAKVTELRQEAQAWQDKVTGWYNAFPLTRNKHLKNIKTVNGWIDEGINQDADERLRNACEWVRSGKTKLYVVTETPDSLERGAAIEGKSVADMDPDTLAYFPDPFVGGSHVGVAQLFYNGRNFRDSTNVTVDEEGAGTKGWNVAGDHIVITEEGVADGKEATFGTLRHEVQHDADKHKESELNAGVNQAKTEKDDAENEYDRLLLLAQNAYDVWKRNKTQTNEDALDLAEQAFDAHENSDAYTQRSARVSMQKALQGYKTEYRAHFYEGRPEFDTVAHDPNNKVTNRGMQWTERQWAIFDNIYRNYDYVEEAWGEDPATPIQLAFRTAVAAYWNPDTEGFNKYDSARVDDLYLALDKVPDGTTDAAAPTVQDVLKAVHKLKVGDLNYLLDPQESVMFQGKFNRHLAGAALQAVMDAMNAESEEYALGESIASLFS